MLFPGCGCQSSSEGGLDGGDDSSFPWVEIVIVQSCSSNHPRSWGRIRVIYWRLLQFALVLQDLEEEIVHQPGACHWHADGLSRQCLGPWRIRCGHRGFVSHAHWSSLGGGVMWMWLQERRRREKNKEKIKETLSLCYCVCISYEQSVHSWVCVISCASLCPGLPVDRLSFHMCAWVTKDSNSRSCMRLISSLISR